MGQRKLPMELKYFNLTYSFLYQKLSLKTRKHWKIFGKIWYRSKRGRKEVEKNGKDK